MTEEEEVCLRWRLVAHYRVDAGLVDVEHNIGELAELHMLIERGPHWDTIERIEITRINPIHPGLTVEQSEDL
jgi:hypothetical protein